MWASLYFIALLIIGNYVLLNVFLAIAVDNITNVHVMTHEAEMEEAQDDDDDKDDDDDDDDDDDESNSIDSGIANGGFDGEDEEERRRGGRGRGGEGGRGAWKKEEEEGYEEGSNDVVAKHLYDDDDDDDDDYDRPKEEAEIVPFSSFYVFSTTNPVRRFCHAVVNYRFFDLLKKFRDNNLESTSAHVNCTLRTRTLTCPCTLCRRHFAWAG